mgnify:CR=1 FL=1
MTDELETAKNFIQEFLPLMEKYEEVLLMVKADPLCPEKIRRAAKKALDFGEEVVDN